MDLTIVGLEYDPIPNQRLPQSGYGRKIAMAYRAVLSDGTKRRVYITIFSNSGTCWIIVKGKKWVGVPDFNTPSAFPSALTPFGNHETQVKP